MARIRHAVEDVKKVTLDGKHLSLGAAATAREMLEEGAARLGDLIEQMEARRGLRMTETQQEASDLGLEILRVAAYPLGFLEPEVLQRLRASARALTLVSSYPLAMDGGRSVERVHEAIRTAERDVVSVIASWNQDSQ